MTTKEEYEKALKEMNDAFYGITFLNSQTRRFDDNLNLLRELVNEHFEEKQETNYEHYKDEIVQNVKYNLAVVNGEPKPCEDTNCDECDFNCDCCGEKRFEWLASPYKKPTYKLTQFEYDLLSVHKDFKTYNKISNQIHLFKMREKGYFKNIDTNIPIREILDNCEVVKDEKC